MLHTSQAHTAAQPDADVLLAAAEAGEGLSVHPEAGKLLVFFSRGEEATRRTSPPPPPPSSCPQACRSTGNPDSQSMQQYKLSSNTMAVITSDCG